MTEYTREQILAMEAGRELDALVAEKVMGWTIIGTKVNKNGYIAYLSDWKPSTDISAAWEVLEQMQMKGIHLCIQPHADFYQIIPYRENGDMMDCVVEKLSAPEAICKAALLAVMGL